MRPIKFREWDQAREDMITGHGMSYSVRKDSDDEVSFVFAHYESDEDWENNHRVLEQYTGLHDKNGREIYEGDLFEHRFGYIVFDDVPHDEVGIECGVVVLEDGQFGVKIQGLGVYNLYGLLLQDGHLDNMPKDDLFVMKISGNVHENPELLEADK